MNSKMSKSEHMNDYDLVGQDGSVIDSCSAKTEWEAYTIFRNTLNLEECEPFSVLEKADSERTSEMVGEVSPLNTLVSLQEKELGEDLTNASQQVVEERHKIVERVFKKYLGREPKSDDLDKMHITRQAYTAEEKLYYDDKLLGVVREGWEDGSFKIKFIPAS